MQELITKIDKNGDQMIELWELLEADFTEPDNTGTTTDPNAGSTVTLTPEETEIK